MQAQIAMANRRRPCAASDFGARRLFALSTATEDCGLWRHKCVLRSAGLDVRLLAFGSCVNIGSWEYDGSGKIQERGMARLTYLTSLPYVSHADEDEGI